MKLSFPRNTSLVVTVGNQGTSRRKVAHFPCGHNTNYRVRRERRFQLFADKKKKKKEKITAVPLFANNVQARLAKPTL